MTADMTTEIRADRQRVARAANEDFALVAARETVLTLVCECGAAECDATLYLERDVFESLRTRRPALYVTTAAHADPSRAVEIRRDCAIVSGWEDTPDWPDELPPPDRARLRRFRRHANDLVGVGVKRLLLCECGRRACTALIQVAPHELVELQARDGRFVVSPGHQLDGDNVLRSGSRFLVVATRQPNAKRASSYVR